MENAFSQQLKNFELQIQSMKDQDLVSTLQKLLDREKRIGDAILLALKEIRTRRIDAAMGYGSLFDMLVKYFKLSESSAYTRLQALKLMDALPEVQEDIASGDLSLSNAALVQGFIQKSDKERETPLSLEEKKEIVDAVKNKSSREAKAELAKKDPIIALPPEKEKPVALNHTQLQMTVDAETMKVLNEVKMLLSHKIPDGNLKEVFKYMLQLTAQTLSKRKGQNNIQENIGKMNTSQMGDANSENSSLTSLENRPLNITNSGTDVGIKESGNNLFYHDGRSKDSNRDKENRTTTKQEEVVVYATSTKNSHSSRTRFISQKVKRKVFQRSGGCCEFVSQEGKRCNSKFQLEYDHKIPWSQGGGNDEGSLQIYCRTHNQYKTKETHGFWYK